MGMTLYYGREGRVNWSFRYNQILKKLHQPPHAFLGKLIPPSPNLAEMERGSLSAEERGELAARGTGILGRVQI